MEVLCKISQNHGKYESFEYSLINTKLIKYFEMLGVGVRVILLPETD